MKHKKHSGGFLLGLLFNMALNIRWTIPAWILLAMHFIFGWSIWWFWLALGIWFLDILVWMCIFGWANRCATPDFPKENKNPYSAKNNRIDRE